MKLLRKHLNLKLSLKFHHMKNILFLREKRKFNIIKIIIFLFESTLVSFKNYYYVIVTIGIFVGSHIKETRII